MNRAIQRTNKLIKTIGYKNFITKRNPVNNFLLSKNSNFNNFIKNSKKNFRNNNDDDYDFENNRKGSYNMVKIFKN